MLVTNKAGAAWRHKLFAFLMMWTVLQFMLVFCRTPIGFISDETLYKRIAYSLFQFKPALSWHYPILYPFLISSGFFFGRYFYEAMLIVNILFKGICLLVIWKLLKRTIDDERRAFYALILIGFSPIYFLYSRVLFAENLACPLLIINVLYHEVYRQKLIDENATFRNKLRYTIVAAFLSLALYWTKYLMLITLPVFCLFWCSIYLEKLPGIYLNRLKRFLMTATIYTLVVVICICAYAFTYALRTGIPFSETLIGTMGFTTGTGPSNNGYAVLVDLKWVMCYTLYALLGSAPIIVGIIVNTKSRLLKDNLAIAILSVVLIITLIYISARHSTYVSYNEGGKMINLCGRYVAYATPLLAICWTRIGNFSKKSESVMHRFVGGFFGIAIVWVAYECLYVFSPGVTQSTSWLTGLRAADNAGFTNFGTSFCWIYCIGIVIILLGNPRIGIVTTSVLMLINSFAAILTCEKYHTRDYENSVICKDFYDSHRNDQVSVLCTESGDYTTLSGMKLFYQVDDTLDGISIYSIANLEEPLWFAGDEYKYIFPVPSELVDKNIYAENGDLYEGSIEQSNVFLIWNSGRFKECHKDNSLQLMGDREILISCSGDDSTVFICGNYILPRNIVGECVTATVDTSWLEEDTIYIYDIGDLTVSKIRLEQ